jgi:hypothetical protein
VNREAFDATKKKEEEEEEERRFFLSLNSQPQQLNESDEAVAKGTRELTRRNLDFVA